MEPKKYAAAAGFRRALEDRLQDIARREGVDLQRLWRQVAFHRLSARLFQAAQPHALLWALKGGYAMELWIKTELVSISFAWCCRQDLRSMARAPAS